jgi:hypothetical protein
VTGRALKSRPKPPMTRLPARIAGEPYAQGWVLSKREGNR